MKKKFTVESYLIELNNVLKSIDQDSIKKCLGIIEKKIKKYLYVETEEALQPPIIW